MVAVNGEAYEVNLADYKDLEYDVISWNNGGESFTQASPGIRVTTFKGTQEEYDKVIAPFVALWIQAKESAPLVGPTPLSPTEGVKAELSTVDVESIRSVRALLLALANADPQMLADFSLDLSKLADLEGKAESLRNELSQLTPKT